MMPHFIGPAIVLTASGVEIFQGVFDGINKELSLESVNA